MGRKFRQKLSAKPYVVVFRVPNLILVFSEYQPFTFIVAILVA
ncbi:hypothetical protein FM106_06130 [Brachybacterium faecium]|nr:hypothetical protein FM106_06130 [Brachybacterium faecium]